MSSACKYEISNVQKKRAAHERFLVRLSVVDGSRGLSSLLSKSVRDVVIKGGRLFSISIDNLSQFVVRRFGFFAQHSGGTGPDDGVLEMLFLLIRCHKSHLEVEQASPADRDTKVPGVGDDISIGGIRSTVEFKFVN